MPHSDAAGSSSRASYPTPDVPGVNDPGAGRRLGLDVGTVRIGVAVSDSMGMLATPVETVRRITKQGQAAGEDFARIIHLVEEYRPVEIIVGLPRNLKGQGSASVQEATFFGTKLAELLAANPETATIAVRYADERLTTVAASNALRASGVNAKKGRAVIDQAAAVAILQHWLDGRASRL
ncbi:Holliday junction resolvase RuvX [Corynebacterium choanae]|uniref:Putative pre-16S rRNA nuclease n=1 Tax=Corynebacterium choanae TaxID=1862358 RepID=A0A3G6J9V7_9CORY|nr:Holliday junction resolvase RuvX [Corynebacterium choanae]AZA13678.1 Putative Holliday junction resolvase [Corynebacterium choanae]